MTTFEFWSLWIIALFAVIANIRLDACMEAIERLAKRVQGLEWHK